MGCANRRCVPEPKSSSALFACPPNPRHLVWLKSGSRPITTCLRPFSVVDFHFCPKLSIFPDCPTPPPQTVARRGVLAPFVHPLCTLCAPFVHPPFCARTPFLHPFCTPFERRNPLSAPFLRGGFCANAFCKQGTKCIHQVQIGFRKRTCNAFFIGPLWPRQGQAFAGPYGVVTPRQGFPCSTHG